MCLAVPMKIVEIRGDRATALLGEVEREVGLALLPDVEVGDYVIVHAGYAIQRLEEDEAKETLEIFKAMGVTDGIGGDFL